MLCDAFRLTAGPQPGVVSAGSAAQETQGHGDSRPHQPSSDPQPGRGPAVLGSVRRGSTPPLRRFP